MTDAELAIILGVGAGALLLWTRKINAAEPLPSTQIGVGYIGPIGDDPGVLPSTQIGVGYIGAIGGDIVEPLTSGLSPGTADMANAIAYAEGFNVPGSIPQRANNPGDLVIPNWTGGSIGDQGISVFISPGDGWARLYNQIEMMVDGRSRVYTSDMTLAQIGMKWTATQSGAWVANVVSFLRSKGYDVADDTTIGEVIWNG